jgi:matrixin
MKRAALPILSLALGASLLSVLRASTTRAAAPLPVRYDATAAGIVARRFDTADVAPASREDKRADVIRRIRRAREGTYINEILLERDSALARWPDRRGDPLTVWIQPQSPVADFRTSYPAVVRSAFEAWDELHLPVQFTFVDDSAYAEVHVTWIDRFAEPISGRTRWSRDDSWHITDANITLAVHHNSGDQLDEDAMRAMALHEIGHLLGLDHTTDSTSIMAPRVRVRELSDADRATARLLYALPAGSLR